MNVRIAPRATRHGLAAVLLLLALPLRDARAGCDNIPSEIEQFRAAQGAITAPYAIPGQSLQVRVRPDVCDATSLGLGDAPACLADESVRVTLLFGAGADGPVHAVVLARSGVMDNARRSKPIGRTTRALGSAGP